ncbi:MAG: DoxX family membrane protein [Anaerolineae bacterium]|nr:DoxX family membrane protein [Anaerolineae bacterium]
MMAITLKKRVIEEPQAITQLLSNPRFSIIWLVIRVWLGWQWIEASSHKIGNPAWVQTGEALKGFWTSAVAIPEGGRPAIAFDWYRSFLQGLLDAQAYTWFAKLVAYGELIIGIALILGMFVGIAAFFSGFMNWNFMMAGSASINPLLFVAAVTLILAWKTAGYLGADFFLLPAIGTPWSRNKFVEEERVVTSPALEPAGD